MRKLSIKNEETVYIIHEDIISELKQENLRH